ncbi:hypothetical protein niasHS_014402 [Heterodera schachtii]|uniref:Transmembrane protein n=1 Tax=Heterodera schachtii TaxID=97005 RepID=A0ABD2IAH8_HETSC
MNTLANRCSFSNLSSFSRSVHIFATGKDLQKFNPMKMPSEFKSAVGRRQLSVQSNSISRETSNLKSVDELYTEADLQSVRKAYEEKLKKTAADLEALDKQLVLWKYASRSLADLQRARKADKQKQKEKVLTVLFYGYLVIALSIIAYSVIRMITM